MLPIREVDASIAELRDVVGRVQRAGAVRDVSFIVELLRAADRLTATALTAIARDKLDEGFGLPPAIVLQMDARRTSWEARHLLRAATTLAAMPAATSAAEMGLLSISQLRAIVAAARTCDAAGRARIDESIADAVVVHADADPDAIVAAVDDQAATLRRDRTERREHRAVEAGFVAIQPTLDGRASLYAEGDAESMATIADALDRQAGPPRDDRTRAQQCFDALVGLCAAGPAGDRRRPRVLATVDLAALTRSERDAAARLLWSLSGGSPRLSPIATCTLLCDADVLPIIFERGQPVAIGDATSPIPAKIRRAVAARDQGCRFPGCGSPLAWADAHHITPRHRGGRSDPDNLVMLCRRCHRRVHGHGWIVSLRAGGDIEFRHRGRRYRSPPPAG
ncbi:MAG TPA: HNH endonuclease [Actinomycetota bacterium]|nr:HNH endonuclease [Actinomycetota bacterium]